MNQHHEEIASAVPADLDALPRRRGFRLRGLEMTRLETFTDAAFAFAVTMLAIAGDRVPDNVGEMLTAFTNVPAFVSSIVVLGIFWRGHWLWSRRYGLEDGTSIFISWTMIVTILIYIYPLKVVFGGMWYPLSGHRFGQAIVVQSVSEARALFAVYAIGFTALSLEMLLLNYRAWRLREPLRLNALEQQIARGELWGWSIPAAVGALALLFSLLLPRGNIGFSGWIYFSLALLVPLHSAHRRRSMKRLAAAQRE